MTSVDEDPKRLVEMYTRLLEERYKIMLAPTADYPDFLRHGNPFFWALHDEVFGIANRINEFWRQLHSLAAWSTILPSLNEGDRYNALVEFVRPTADHCLTAPYSIKSMLTTSVCRISHQTRLFFETNFKETLKEERWLNYNEAKRLANGFRDWPALEAAFSKLNAEDYEKDSAHYRNSVNHSFAPNIEIGLQFKLQRRPESDESRKNVSYQMIFAQPLSLDKLVPLLTDQYRAARDCFERYVDLVREQHALWPKSDPD
jgi:hypothetical protein